MTRWRGEDFEIKRDDVREFRFVPRDVPQNNFTYAVMREAVSYWKHFPASEPAWGRLPVWGFAPSPARVGFVEASGVYDRVVSYDEVDALEARTAVYVDFSGDAKLREAVHRHYGDRLTRSVLVGLTHWADLQPPGDELPGPAAPVSASGSPTPGRRSSSGSPGGCRSLAAAVRRRSRARIGRSSRGTSTPQPATRSHSPHDDPSAA